jgi:phospholipid transport system substrate-binding protein
MNKSLSIWGTVAAITASVSAPALAQSAAPARAAAYNDAIIAVMKAKAALPARTEHFRAIVSTYYDMPAIAALVAGPAWTSAPAADRQALTTALTRHSAIQLAKNFKSYDGEKFLIDPAVQTRGDSSIVKTTIAGSGGSKDVLYYRMRGGRIIDVISGGVSQLAVQRSDVSSLAAGGVGAIVKRLNEVDGKAG